MLILIAIIVILPCVCISLISDAIRERRQPIPVIQTRKELLRHMKAVLARNHFLDLIDGHPTASYYNHDLHDILTFDKLIHQGEDVMFPKMRTKAGKEFWDAYIDLYLEERFPKSQDEQNEAMLKSGGWRCSCGRANAAYTSTCVCGTNKTSVPLAVRNKSFIPDQPASWLCACGRNNPAYTSTCVCGTSKRDVQAVLLKKEDTEHESI